jgi:hypothetical protein
MRWSTLLPFGILLVCGLAAVPAHGEQVTYYVWTDDEGVIHAEDAPPTDYDYETRTIDVDTNVAPPADSGASGDSSSPGTESGGGNAPSTESSPRGPTTDADRAIADEEQKRLEQGMGPESGGAETAPGADTANPSATAPAADAAAGGSAAEGAATAPGATITPSPVVGP